MNELVEVAILAFRSGRFRDSIELLVQVLDGDDTNWMASLYLGMSYQQTGQTSDAHRIFKKLAIICPDEHVRAKAQMTMPLLDAELRKRFQRETPAVAQTREVYDEVTSLG